MVTRPNEMAPFQIGRGMRVPRWGSGMIGIRRLLGPARLAFAAPSGSAMAQREPLLLEPSPGAARLDRRTLVVFGTAVLLLIIFEYWALPTSFNGTRFHERLADVP